MASVNKIESATLLKKYTLALIITLCTLYTISCYRSDFRYDFYGTEIKFPMTVQQAVEKYKILPHQYNRSGVAFSSPCPPGVPTNGISEIFYVDRADDYISAPPDSLNRDVYAVKFCFDKQSAHSFGDVKNRLEDNFGKQFELKQNSDSNEPYYQLTTHKGVTLIIEFYPEFVYVFDKNKINDPKAWAISFCYTSGSVSIRDYTKYERNYDAQ